MKSFKSLILIVTVLIVSIIIMGCNTAIKESGISESPESSITESVSETGSELSDSESATSGSDSVSENSNESGSSISESESSSVESLSPTPVLTPKPTAKPTPTPTLPAVEVKQYYTSQAGIWYELFYSLHQAEFPVRWINESRSTPVKDGYYHSGDIDKTRRDFIYLKKIGFEYLVLDDTNYHLADGGAIAMSADNCFLVAAELGNKAPKLAFAGGRPLIEGKVDMMLGELNIFHAYYKVYPDNYFIWKGKPLFINFNNPFNFGYKDPKDRFTIRPATGLVSNSISYTNKFDLDEIGVWGWAFDAQYINSEVYGITPGWSRSHNDMVEFHGPISRENGKRYQRMWLEAIKTNPETIVITGWNEHVEETGIEAVTLSEVVEGREKEHLNPYYYQEITEGYLALRTGYLENFYYQSESGSQLYQYKNKKLIKVASVPEMTAVIVVPSDYFEWSEVAFG